VRNMALRYNGIQGFVDAGVAGHVDIRHRRV